MSALNKTRRSAAATTSTPQTPMPEPTTAADGLGPLRGWLGQCLVAARQSAALMEDWQRLNTQAAASWVESLALAEREVDRAEGLAALMALPAQIWNRQLDVWIRRLGEGSQHLLEAELQWTEDARTRARALGLPWWTGNGQAWPAREPLDGAAAADPLRAIGQMQQAWLELSQRWVDGMAAGGATRH